MMAIAARFDLELIQYDAVNAFVHASLCYDLKHGADTVARQGTLWDSRSWLMESTVQGNTVYTVGL